MALTPISRTSSALRAMVEAANTTQSCRKTRSVHFWAVEGGCQIWPGCQAVTSSRVRAISEVDAIGCACLPQHSPALTLEGSNSRLSLGNNCVGQRHITECLGVLLALGQTVGNKRLQGIQLFFVVVFLIEDHPRKGDDRIGVLSIRIRDPNNQIGW